MMSNTSRTLKRELNMLRDIPYVTVNGGRPYYNLIITRDKKCLFLRVKFPPGYPAMAPVFLYPPNPTISVQGLVDGLISNWSPGMCLSQICAVVWESLSPEQKE